MSNDSFFISSQEPLSSEGNFSLVYPVENSSSRDYVGKVLKWSFLAPNFLFMDQFSGELKRELTIANDLWKMGFSIPRHYNVSDLEVPGTHRTLPTLVMDRVDIVPETRLPKPKLLRALRDIIDEKMLAEFEGFVPGCDFYTNLLYSRVNNKFMMVDFAYWMRR